MELIKIWNNFSERMSEIELYHRAAKESANKELKLIQQYADSIEKNEHLKEMSLSIDNMSFIDARTANTKFYNQTRRSIKERNLHIHLHKNKQYQWLLAEAYEEFEGFIENIYAFYGVKNNSFWPLKDYGNISLSELSEKEYEWYLTQVSKKKDVPNSILNRFRKQFQELKTVEVDNKLKVNLSLAITLIEKLRHIIVHRGGTVENKDEFIRLVVEKSGLYNNGNIAQQHVSFIEQFFGGGDYSNLITILEIPADQEIPLNMHISMFGKLTNYLMAYAFLLYELINQGIGDENA